MTTSPIWKDESSFLVLNSRILLSQKAAMDLAEARPQRKIRRRCLVPFALVYSQSILFTPKVLDSPCCLLASQEVSFPIPERSTVETTDLPIACMPGADLGL